MKIFLIILISILLFSLIAMLLMEYFIALYVYKAHFVRKDEPYNRNPSSLETDEEIEMYDKANKLNEKLKDKIKDVEIEYDSFKLKGEYVDLGYKKCVIIIPGRTENCKYSYYFAYPYVDSGYNLLLIDNRSHGYSEGKNIYLGLKEYKDILNWVKYAHDELKNDIIIAHGICIGSATALYSLLNNECPSYFKGLVADGMYVNFVESYNNHVRERKKPVHFVSEFFFMIMKHRNKINPYYGPIDCIEFLDKPILFLFSKEDIYSTPIMSEKLFNKCGSNEKEIVWFDKGAHSKIRINNEEKYDKSIKDFINKKFN